MKILGITDGISSGAAIVEDNQILSAVNEERLCRKKMAIGFPRESIKKVFELTRLRPSDIDAVAIATENVHFYEKVSAWDGWFEAKKGLVRQLFQDLASDYSALAHKLPGLHQAYYTARYPAFRARRKRIAEIVEEEFDLKAPLHFINHHLAHAASAYFPCGDDSRLIVTLDGGGDQASSHVYYAGKGRLTKLHQLSSFDSLANYYMYGTHLCGFKAQKHEGKITGLAAFGQSRYFDILQTFISSQNGDITNQAGVVFAGAVRALRKALPQDFDKRDLAASLQKHLEENAVPYVAKWLRQSKCKKLAVAGGVFANVRLNQKIHELPEVEDFFVFPAMSDEGLAVGAAFAYFSNALADKHFMPRKVQDVYLGPSYSTQEITAELDRFGLPREYKEDMENEIARKLADGYIVARFHGRMEYGPRALGNRSVLYHPCDRSVNDWLNSKLRRTEFMPFAPSTLHEYADRCFVNLEGARETAKYMTITFDCTDWMKTYCPGVVHVDGTARPQLVCEKQNPQYHKVIDRFRALTGIPSIVNTSFNMHEEPIVSSPRDAIRGFLDGHLDYLAIESFLVKNPRPIDRVLIPSLRA